MKYKPKFKATPEPHYSGYTSKVDPEFTYNDEDGKGVFVFIPFTDQRFFEPVKTRTFQVEVNEDEMPNFEYRVNYEEWKVTEITEPSWITDYKSSGSYNAHLFSTDELSTIDTKEFKDEYQYGNKLQGVKWLKDRFGKGLKESKELADFIFALSV